jgi:putative acetyltransferase
VEDEKVVGHIFFSPAEINHKGKTIKGMGLAPMAVHTEYQNKSIGSLLVKKGIKKIKISGCPFIIVLGHEKYYPRFGFETASKYGIKPQWEGVPDEAFMIMILDKETMAGVSGVATYRKEFDEAM